MKNKSSHGLALVHKIKKLFLKYLVVSSFFANYEPK